jgi:hypothetical protein
LEDIRMDQVDQLRIQMDLDENPRAVDAMQRLHTI